jgi:hypothetical protein
VLVNNARLNAIFLPEFEIVRLLDWNLGVMKALPVGRAMYERGYKVEIAADMRFASEAQRLQEANDLVAMATQVPHLQQNQAFMYAALKKLLEAKRAYDMVRILGAPPPPPQQFGIMPEAPPQGQGAPQA